MSRIISSLLFLSFIWISNAVADEELRIQKYHFNKERQPISIIDILTSPEGKQILTGVATLFGVPPEVSGLILAAPSVKDRTSEEGDITIPLDSGYRFCDLRYEEISLNPPAGSERARIRVVGNERAVNIPFWLKKRGWGHGRSWFDINVTVLSVRDDVYNKYSQQCKQIGTVYRDTYPDNCC